MFCSKFVESLESNVELEGTVKFGIIRDEELWLCKLLDLRLEVDDLRSFDLCEEPPT